MYQPKVMKTGSFIGGVVKLLQKDGKFGVQNGDWRRFTPNTKVEKGDPLSLDCNNPFREHYEKRRYL